MRKITLSIIIAISLGFCFAVPCCGWLIFHESEYRGKIIDAGTKKPIEGVVIVALYYGYGIIGGPGGAGRRFINAKEALTDRNGEFVIPSYTTLTGPNTVKYETEFVIYKSGYASYPDYRLQIYPFKYCGPGYLFNKTPIGKREEIKITDTEVVTVPLGIAELPRLKTSEERIKAMSSMPLPDECAKTPLLMSAINEERKRFSLSPIGPVRR
jgi:hypothetical protein